MELILGTAQFDGHYGAVRDVSALFPAWDLLQAARREGFSALDTAPAYAGAETAIGQFGWQGRVHTKIAKGIDPGDSLNISLENLRVPSVEVLYFHDPRVLRRPRAYVSRIRDSLPRSKVSLLGVSVYTPEEMETAIQIPELEVIQVPVNLADGRFDSSLFAEAKSRGMRVYARSVFLQGMLLQEAQHLPEDTRALKEVLREISFIVLESGRSAMELAIGWAKSIPGVSGLVLGAETPNQIKQLAVASGSIELDENTLSRLRLLGIKEQRLLDPRMWGK